MTNFQKRLAADILKVGKKKVYMNPQKVSEISKAITRADVRRLIMKNTIKKKSSKIKKPKINKTKRRKHGSKKGKKHSIITSKRKWINTIRPLRRELKVLKTSQKIEDKTYRKMRLLAKGGMFRNRSHLRLYLEQHNLLKKE